MKEYKITIEKTARYFTYGKLAQDTKSIWIVLHGYGQLAKFFIRKFNVLDNGSTFVVAPEATNKFYLNGFSGRVGATWMTKENREIEISDNIKHLQQFFNEVLNGINLDNIQVNVLGFSQGTKTASYWVLNSKIKVDNLILWGGSLPPDVNFEYFKEKLSLFKLHIVIGKSDKFISQERAIEEIKYLKSKSINFTFHDYKGKHDIEKNTLVKLCEQL